jgi:hypothetical protein
MKVSGRGILHRVRRSKKRALKSRVSIQITLFFVLKLVFHRYQLHFFSNDFGATMYVNSRFIIPCSTFFNNLFENLHFAKDNGIEIDQLNTHMKVSGRGILHRVRRSKKRALKSRVCRRFVFDGITFFRGMLFPYTVVCVEVTFKSKSLNTMF